MTLTRRLYENIVTRHFRGERKMLFLMGPRQVGKTTTSLESGRGRAASTYLNWDNFDHQREILEGPSRLAEKLGLTTLREDKPLLILDEIHKYPSWRNLLKGFFDTWADAVDVLVTGSARLSVFHSGGDSLMGRYFSYRMHPLSVAELVEPGATCAPSERPPLPIDDGALGALFELYGPTRATAISRSISSVTRRNARSTSWSSGTASPGSWPRPSCRARRSCRAPWWTTGKSSGPRWRYK